MSSIWTRHLGAIWTHVASACHPDESSRGRYSATAGRFMHKGTSIGKIRGRCNVKNPREDGRDPGWNCLEAVYRRESQDDWVSVKLIRVSNSTGGIYEVEPFVTSHGSGADENEQTKHVVFDLSFDFEEYAYYVEIMVDRSQASADAGIYPSVSIVRLKEIPERLDWEIRLDRLRVERPYESGDEPYFVMLGFRSTVETPGSTRVFWGGELDDDWAEDSEAGDEHNIPRAMGVVAFPDVRYVSVREMMRGTSPEVIGAVALAFESNATSWDTMRVIIGRIRAIVDTGLREIIEGMSLDDFQGYLVGDTGDLEEAFEEVKERCRLPLWAEVAVSVTSLHDPDVMIGDHYFFLVPTDPLNGGFSDDQVEAGGHMGVLAEYQFTLAEDSAIRFEGEGAVYLVNASVVALPPE